MEIGALNIYIIPFSKYNGDEGVFPPSGKTFPQAYWNPACKGTIYVHIPVYTNNIGYSFTTAHEYNEKCNYAIIL